MIELAQDIGGVVQNAIADREVLGDKGLVDRVSVVGGEDDAVEVFVIFDQDGVVNGAAAKCSGDLVEEVDGDGWSDVGVGEDIVVLSLPEGDEVVGGAVFVYGASIGVVVPRVI